MLNLELLSWGHLIGVHVLLAFCDGAFQYLHGDSGPDDHQGDEQQTGKQPIPHRRPHTMANMGRAMDRIAVLQPHNRGWERVQRDSGFLNLPSWEDGRFLSSLSLFMAFIAISSIDAG